MVLVRRKYPLIVCLVAAAVAWAVAIAPAQAEIKISPVIEIDEEYTDNYFRSSANKTDAYITRVSAGVSFDAYTDRSRLKFDYTGSGYLHQGDTPAGQNLSDQNYIGHNFTLYAATTVGSRFLFGIEDEYFLTREPASVDRFSLAVTRDKYWVNRVTPFVTYDLSEKGSIKLAYRNEIIDYTEGLTNLDAEENRYFMTLTYNLNDTNHLDFEGQNWDHRYDVNANSYNSNQARVILRHEFNDLLSGEIGAGYQWRDFESPTAKDWEGAVVNASLTGRSDLSTLFVSYQHGINDQAENDGYSTHDKVDFYGERLLAEAIPVRLGGFYQWSQGEGNAEGGQLWGVNFGIGYRFLHDRLECGLNYGYTDKSPDISPGYEENRISLYIRGYFGPTEE